MRTHATRTARLAAVSVVCATLLLSAAPHARADGVCGDGVVDAPEDCDDGDANGTSASCCAADCTFAMAATPCDAGTCDGGGQCAPSVTTTTSTTESTSTTETTSTTESTSTTDSTSTTSSSTTSSSSSTSSSCTTTSTKTSTTRTTSSSSSSSISSSTTSTSATTSSTSTTSPCDVAGCTSGDGCCPSGCDVSTDADCVDAYMCDKAAANVAAGGVKFTRATAPVRTITDAFGADTCRLKKEDAVCDAAQANEGPPARQPDVWELSYRLACGTRFAPVDVRVTDPLNPVPVDVRVLRRFNLLVPSGAQAPGPVPPAAPPPFTADRFLCYKVRGPVFAVGASVSDVLYPDGYPRLALYRMTKLCTPADSAGLDPTAPSHPGRLTCYLARLGAGLHFARTYLSTRNDDVGAQVVQVSATTELCLPATIVP